MQHILMYGEKQFKIFIVLNLLLTLCMYLYLMYLQKKTYYFPPQYNCRKLKEFRELMKS